MEQEVVHYSKRLLILGIILTFFITAISSGLAIYIWKGNNIKELETQIDSLENTILVKEEETCIETTEEEDLNNVVNNECEKYEPEETYPVVFTPSGKFTKLEKTTLITKLVKPYFDYYQDSSNTSSLDDVIAMEISKDDNTPNYYLVDVIFDDDSLQSEDEFGYSGFLFGSTRSDYPYWIPECAMEECTISNQYKEKYPEVVEAFNACLPNACELYYDFE